MHVEFHGKLVPHRNWKFFGIKRTNENEIIDGIRAKLNRKFHLKWNLMTGKIPKSTAITKTSNFNQTYYIIIRYKKKTSEITNNNGCDKRKMIN